MGIIFRPEDAMKGKKHIIKKALKDLSPDLRKSVEKILHEWEGESSEEKLVRIVGREKASHIIKEYRS
jgi:hypothetical protein